MTVFNFEVLLLWFDNIVQILQWVAVVLALAHISMRVKWLKKAIRSAQAHWYAALIASIFFGLLAILGNHSRIIWETNIHNGHLEIMQYLSSKKFPGQPSVSLRDLMILVAGLSAGPWVGLGSGLIAGSERLLIGGHTGLISSMATLLFGFFAGLMRCYCPRCISNRWGIFALAIAATLIKMLLIYYCASEVEWAHNLVWATILPATAVNAIGCLLFLSVIQDLKRERQEHLLQTATLRTLKAQIEPHFLNGALSKLHAFIRTDPDKARDFVLLLRDFCNDTRKFTDRNTISLQQEMIQLQRYLDIQSLRLGDKLQVTFAVPEHLFTMQVLPGCLLTFVENAIYHGFMGLEPPYTLAICAEDNGNQLILSVCDNGIGITPKQRLALGNSPVHSSNDGGGIALFQLVQCLTLIFDENARITFENNKPKGTRATLIQPILKHERSNL